MSSKTATDVTHIVIQLHGCRHPKCPALTQPLECLTATSKLPCDWTTVLGQRNHLFPLALLRHRQRIHYSFFCTLTKVFTIPKKSFEYLTTGLFLLVVALYSVLCISWLSLYSRLKKKTESKFPTTNIKAHSSSGVKNALTTYTPSQMYSLVVWVFFFCKCRKYFPLTGPRFEDLQLWCTLKANAIWRSMCCGPWKSRRSCPLKS